MGQPLLVRPPPRLRFNRHPLFGQDTNGSFLTKEVNVDEASKVTPSSEVFGDGGSSFKFLGDCVATNKG